MWISRKKYYNLLERVSVLESKVNTIAGYSGGIGGHDCLGGMLGLSFSKYDSSYYPNMPPPRYTKSIKQVVIDLMEHTGMDYKYTRESVKAIKKKKK